MKLSRVSLAIAAILGTGASSAAFAIDLYVDTKTEQIYANPGPGRVHLGSFVKEEQAKGRSRQDWPDNSDWRTETADSTGYSG